MRAIVCTAATGWAPTLVSPESMTASAPSSTALATSEASARVGRRAAPAGEHIAGERGARVAGGDDIFPELAVESLAKHRILADGNEVVRRAPDIIMGSWCGKRFRPEKVATRPGWETIPAVRDGELHEIKSPLILQPGPAALTDGVRAIADIVQAWAARKR